MKNFLKSASAFVLMLGAAVMLFTACDKKGGNSGGNGDVDKTKLEALIIECEALLDGATADDYPEANIEAFTNAVVSNSSITACYYLAADFDFLLKIVCRSSMQLEEIHRFIKIQPGVSSTRTHYVLKDVKHTYSPIWEELPDSHR